MLRQSVEAFFNKRDFSPFNIGVYIDLTPAAQSWLDTGGISFGK